MPDIDMSFIQIILGSALGSGLITFISSCLDRDLKKKELQQQDDREKIAKIDTLADQIIEVFSDNLKTNNNSQEIKLLNQLGQMESVIQVMIAKGYNKKLGKLYIKFKKKVDIFDGQESLSTGTNSLNDLISHSYDTKAQIMKLIEACRISLYKDLGSISLKNISAKMLMLKKKLTKLHFWK